MDYVKIALDSLIAQDFSDWTALVLDDSPDGSAELKLLVDALCDPRFTYLRNDGAHGIGNAWNACIDAADTDLFCFLHADDAYEPSYVSTMLNLAQGQQYATLLFCGARIIGEDGSPTFSLADSVKRWIQPREEPIFLHGSRGVESLMVGNYIMCPTVMYRRSRLGDERFSNCMRFTLDLDLFLRVLFSSGIIVGTHRVGYRYRRHPAQATAVLSRVGDRFREELDLFRESASLAKQRQWHDACRAAKLRPTFRLNALLSRRLQYVLA